MADESSARPDELRKYAQALGGAVGGVQSAAGAVERAQAAWEQTKPDFGRWTGAAAAGTRASARRWQELAASVQGVATAFVRADAGQHGACPTFTTPETGLVAVPTAALDPYVGVLLPTNAFSRLPTTQRIARARADARRLLAAGAGGPGEDEPLYAALRWLDSEEVADPVYAAALCNQLGIGGLQQVLDALARSTFRNRSRLPDARRGVRRLSTAFAVATHTLPDPVTGERSSPVGLDERMLNQLLTDDQCVRTLNALLTGTAREPRSDIVARAAEQLLVIHPSARRGDDASAMSFLTEMAGGAPVDRPVLDRLAASPVATTALIAHDRAAARAVITAGAGEPIAAKVVRTGLIDAAAHPEWGFHADSAEAGVRYLVANPPGDGSVSPAGKVVLADLVNAYPQLFGEIARDLTNEGPRPVGAKDLQRYFQLVVSDPTAALRVEAIIAAVSQTALMRQVDAIAASGVAHRRLDRSLLASVAEPVGALASQFEVAIRRDRTHHSQFLAALYTLLGHTKELAALGVVAAPFTAGQSAVLVPVGGHAIDAVLGAVRRSHPADTKGTSTDVRHDLQLALRAQVTAALLADPGIATEVTTEEVGGRRFFDRSRGTFLPPGRDDAAAFDRWLSASPALNSAVSGYMEDTKSSWAFELTGD